MFLPEVLFIIRSFWCELANFLKTVQRDVYLLSNMMILFVFKDCIGHPTSRHTFTTTGHNIGKQTDVTSPSMNRHYRVTDLAVNIRQTSSWFAVQGSNCCRDQAFPPTVKLWYFAH